MAGANKNQRKAAAAVAAKSGGMVSEGSRIIIPLNAGKHAYLLFAGRSEHVATGSERWNTLIDEIISSGQGRKLEGELGVLAENADTAWPKVLAELSGRQAFEAADA